MYFFCICWKKLRSINFDGLSSCPEKIFYPPVTREDQSRAPEARIFLFIASPDSDRPRGERSPCPARPEEFEKICPRPPVATWHRTPVECSFLITSIFSSIFKLLQKLSAVDVHYNELTLTSVFKMVFDYHRKIKIYFIRTKVIFALRGEYYHNTEVNTCNCITLHHS